MLNKFLIVLTLLLLVNLAYAGSYEDALAKNNNVFLYLYTKDCSTCRQFDKIFRCVKKTAFGKPSDPEVNNTTAGSSGVTFNFSFVLR